LIGQNKTRRDMKKHSIARYLFIGMTAFLFVACSQEEEAEKMNAPIPLKIMINESQSVTTRASISGLSTEFESGDTIGIFVVDEYYDRYYNIPYIFDGSNWNLAASAYVDNVSFYDNCDYFAYYPYQESLSSWTIYSDSDEDGTITADEYFVNIIDGWTVQTDQSTKANYNASDLMAGKGTITSTTDGIVSFTLNHKMGLLRIKLYNSNGEQVTNISDTSTELFSNTSANPKLIPFKVEDEFYYIAKAGSEITFYFLSPMGNLDEEEISVTPTAGHVSDISFTVY